MVVPVYNAAEYLPLCLDSIAAQSFSQFCCVLADDGSPQDFFAESRAWLEGRGITAQQHHRSEYKAEPGSCL